MTAVTVERLYQSLYTQTYNKVVCVGKNYALHAKEMGGDVPKAPLLFDKPLSKITKSGEILYLRGGNEVHHEVELGFLIGKKASKVAARDWQDYVEGFFVGIDFTDRDLQSAAKKNGSPWTLAKSQDGFLAVGTYVQANKVRNPHDLELALKINDKYVQKDNTRHMVFQVPTLIEYISSYMTLNEGDMVLTGTPSGVGPVKAGDYLYASLKQLNEEVSTLSMKIEKAHS